MDFTEKSHLSFFVENFLLINNHQTNLSYNNYNLRYLQEKYFFIKKSSNCPIKGKKGQRYFNEKYIIKDKNGAILKKSENLNQLISKTSWNKLKLVK